MYVHGTLIIPVKKKDYGNYISWLSNLTKKKKKKQ